MFDRPRRALRGTCINRTMSAIKRSLVLIQTIYWDQLFTPVSQQSITYLKKSYRIISRGRCAIARSRLNAPLLSSLSARNTAVSSHRRWELCTARLSNTFRHYTITTASSPQNRKGYWSIIVWTTSSRYGLIASNLPRSLNSIGNNVGHQQIAKFLLSILLSLQFSATLKTI